MVDFLKQKEVEYQQVLDVMFFAQQDNDQIVRVFLEQI